MLRAAIVRSCALLGTRRKLQVIWLSTELHLRKQLRFSAIHYRILFLIRIILWKRNGSSLSVRRSRAILVVAHLDDGELVRIISAREATHGERESYEKN